MSASFTIPASLWSTLVDHVGFHKLVYELHHSEGSGKLLKVTNAQ